MWIIRVIVTKKKNFFSWRFISTIRKNKKATAGVF